MAQKYGVQKKNRKEKFETAKMKLLGSVAGCIWKDQIRNTKIRMS
jgi:hypothetical protein